MPSTCAATSGPPSSRQARRYRAPEACLRQLLGGRVPEPSTEKLPLNTRRPQHTRAARLVRQQPSYCRLLIPAVCSALFLASTFEALNADRVAKLASRA